MPYQQSYPNIPGTLPPSQLVSLTQIASITSRSTSPSTTPLATQDSSQKPKSTSPRSSITFVPTPTAQLKTLHLHSSATTSTSFKISASARLAKPGGGPAVIPMLGEKKVMDFSLTCAALFEVEEIAVSDALNAPRPDVDKPDDYQKLEELDGYLESVGLQTQFARWVPKVFELYQSAVVLMGISSSKRLSYLLSTNVEFCPVPNSPPIRSPIVLNRADLVEIMTRVVSIHSAGRLPDGLDLPDDPSSFVDQVLLPRLNEHTHPTIHAEITLTLYLKQRGLASSTYPFLGLGLSKSSCTPCVELLALINSQDPIFDSPHSWSWVYPDEAISDPRIKVGLVQRLRELLLREFVDFIRDRRDRRRAARTSVVKGLVEERGVEARARERLEKLFEQQKLGG
ncbi:hypothetical protein PQX77_019255 [Marasmius sp. AFHP31]|nr:hypothetical protein PQX77_019255 [Marasmius sp. AFHP31]